MPEIEDTQETDPFFKINTNRLTIDVVGNKDQSLTFIAKTKADDAYVGRVDVTVKKEPLGRVGELSYQLEDGYSGQRLTTEILRATIAYIYAELGLVNLYGVAPQTNIAAQYVLQRIGFALSDAIDGALRYEATNPRFQAI